MPYHRRHAGGKPGVRLRAGATKAPPQLNVDRWHSYGGQITLLRAIVLCARDEDLSHRFAELHACDVVHRVVNAGPDSRVAGLLTYGTNELGMRRKHDSYYLRLSRPEQR